MNNLWKGIAIAGIWIATAFIFYMNPNIDTEIVLGSTIASVLIGVLG